MCKTRLANLAHAQKLELQHSGRISGLLRLPLEVQRKIFTYAVDGDGRDIIVGRNAGRFIYYRGPPEENLGVFLPVKGDERPDSVNHNYKRLLVSEHPLVTRMMYQIRQENIFIIGSLCDFTSVMWGTLPLEVNTWTFFHASTIARFSQDLGEQGQLSLRKLKIYVDTQKEAHALRHVDRFRELRTLFIRIPHIVFVHADQLRWKELASLFYLVNKLDKLTDFTIGCRGECNDCVPFGDLTRKEQYKQWAI